MRRDGTVLGESAVGRKLVALTTRRVIILVRRRRALFSLMEVPQDFHRFPNSIHGWSSKLRHKQTQALSPLSNLYQAFSLDTDGLSLSYRYWWCYFACPSRPFWQRLEMMRQTVCIVCQYLPVPFRCSRGIYCQQLSPRYEWPSVVGGAFDWICQNRWHHICPFWGHQHPMVLIPSSRSLCRKLEPFLVPHTVQLSIADATQHVIKRIKESVHPHPRTHTHTQNLYGWCRLRSDPSRTWIRDHSCGFWASCHVDNT